MMKQENLPLTSLRGVAALWVVAHHLVLRFVDLGLSTPDRFLFPGGVAVDIFFILSGLVMAATYRDLTPSAIPAFMIRRIFRIYPLHLFVMTGLICLAILLTLAGHPGPPGYDWSRLPGALLLLQPFRDQPLTWNVASWSVGVEMACYLAFPLFLPLVRALPRVAIALLVVAFGVIEFLVLSRVGAVVAGGGAVARGFAGFAFGMVIALSLRGARLPQWAQNLLEPAAVLAIVAALAAGRPELTPMFGAVLIALLFTGRGPVAAVFEKAPLHWLGKVSYSVYLVHLPVIGVFATAPKSAWLLGAVGPVIWSALATALVLAVSHVCWLLIEEPARRYGARLARGQRLAVEAPTPRGPETAGVA